MKTSLCSDTIFFLNILVELQLVTGWPTLPAWYLGPQKKFHGPWQHDWVGNQVMGKIFTVLEIPKFQRWACQDYRIQAQAATDKTQSSTWAEQPQPAPRKETARQFAAERLIYWGYKSHMLSVSQAWFSSALLLQWFLVRICSLYTLGQAARLQGGMEAALPSPRCFGSETLIQNLLNGSDYAETLETVFMYKAICLKPVSQL